MSASSQVQFLSRGSAPHVVTLVALAGVSALSMNVFLPSLPSMSAYFSADYRLMQLSVALYLGVNAALQIIVGPISDRYGRRPVILWALVLFCVATLGCIIAPTVEVFLAFRMTQAVIVAGMVLSRAVIRDMVPAEEAASMIGYVTMGMSLVPMAGPVIGGVLDEAFGWHASFVLLLILGLVVLVLAWADLGETATSRTTSFRAQFRQYPELLGSRRFWGYCAAAAFASGAFFSYLGGAPFVGTEVFGLSAARLGLYFGAPAVGYALGNYVSGRYSTRIGIDRMILAGTVISTAGLAASTLLTLVGASSAESFFAFVTFVGLGNGMVLPNANAGMLSVRPHLAGTAAGLGGAIMIGGGAALSAVAGALLGPDSDELPLQLLMLSTSVLSVLAIAYVRSRARKVAA
ncbi:MAG: Bcr/CflA family efflux MFS transporter [Alphaproteobacteria bacterium]|nr:MAG: Bcr/CflA family efflux MFS transporter [Alphaproteobacteria bacterium]